MRLIKLKLSIMQLGNDFLFWFWRHLFKSQQILTEELSKYLINKKQIKFQPTKNLINSLFTLKNKAIRNNHNQSINQKVVSNLNIKLIRKLKKHWSLMIEEKPQIDQNALSRQLAVYGHEAQGKLMAMKVFLFGVTGLGIQIAKNLILAGPKQVTLYDPTTVNILDVGRNFYAKKQHVGKVTRAEASITQLKDLNPSVQVDIANDADIAVISTNYTCVVVLDYYDRDYLIKLNAACRQNNVGFLYAGNLGLYGFTFVDFGDNHKVIDTNGEQEKTIHIAGITQDEAGVVYLHDEKKHGLSDGDTVTFREVKGMEEINGKEYKITIRSPDSFTIGDTTKFSPYVTGGLAAEVKVPVFQKFYSLQKSLSYPYPPESKEMPICSWQKFGYPEQLHVILNGVIDFWGKHKRLPNNLSKEDAAELLKLAQDWQANKIDQEGYEFKVEKLDEKLVSNVSMFAQTQISPVCSFWGGIITQEIVKMTGKYSPLRQWLHHEFFEVLPEGEVQRSHAHTRYGDYNTLFGDEFVKASGEAVSFVIGTGALGCELIKMFALMGVGTHGKGKTICTDDDNIEISNLNRQFLFRREHVGSNKCEIACQAGKKINKKARFQSLKYKVSPENEDFFNDEFWNKLDIVVCAVDNVKARQYIDNQCVWYEKPLFESGTLGTKCHSQIVIPHETQSYNDIIDPPEETIPLCTLKNFPYQIEHTIQWAREYFEGIIAQPSQDLRKFYENKQHFLDSILKENRQNPSIARSKLETLKKMYQANESKSYSKCVQIAVNIFWDVFHNQIAQLLHAFPENHIIEQTGKPFWSGLKRAPKVISLDLHDDLQVQLIQATANILAFVFNIQLQTNTNVIRSLAKEVVPQKFVPKKIKIEVDEKDKNKKSEPVVEISEEDQVTVKNLYEELMSLPTDTMHAPTVVEFEKDDPTNWHIEFMSGVSNLRARNYKIDEVDNFKVKLIAGKIIPAIATTTAMVVGVVGIEIIKYFLKKKVESYKNVTINLALPLWVFNDPLPPIEITDKEFDPIMAGPVKAIPSKFNKWKKIDVKGPLTVEQFKNKFEKEFNIEVSMITYGTSTVYTSFGKDSKARLPLNLKAAIEAVTKKQIPKWRTILPVGVSGNLADGTDCLLPDVRYHL